MPEASWTDCSVGCEGGNSWMLSAGKAGTAKAVLHQVTVDALKGERNIWGSRMDI